MILYNFIAIKSINDCPTQIVNLFHIDTDAGQMSPEIEIKFFICHILCLFEANVIQTIE